MALRKQTDYIVLHCSATPLSQSLGVKDIDRMHRAKGFFRIGFHFVICRDGTIEKGRELFEVGTHIKRFNHRSIGICLVGGLSEKSTKRHPIPENNFTPEQWEALELLLTMMEGLFKDVKIVGANQLDSKQFSPSFDVQAWLEEGKKLTYEDILQIEQELIEEDPDYFTPAQYPTLQVGSEGTLVGFLQSSLNVEVDGQFGPETEQTIKAFQKENGLTPDGIVGPETWTLLQQ